MSAEPAASNAPVTVRDPSSHIEELVEQMYGVHVVSYCHFVRGVADLDRHQDWRVDGCRSTVEYLTMRFGMSFASATRAVRLGRRLAELPALDAAMEAGRLSIDVVEIVARFATAETDAELTEKALGWTAAEATAAARQATPPKDDDPHEATLQLRTRMDEASGVLRISGELPGEHAAAFVAALEREEQHVPVDPVTGTFQPHTMRLGQALMNLVGARLAVDPDPDRATVVIHARHEDFHDPEGSADLLDLGVRVTASTLELMTCDCNRIVVVVDEHDQPIGIGRKSKTVPRWLRRLVKKRDHGRCVFPGCDSRRFLDCHHLVHWSKGGPTDLDNLALLCRFHHRWLHKKGWGLRRRPGGRTHVLIDPTGRERTAYGRVLSPTVRARVFWPPPDLAAAAA